MIQVLAGTVAGVGRFMLKIHDETWKTEYAKDGAILDTGRMLVDNEEFVWDRELGCLERSEIVLWIDGPGKCHVAISAWSIDVRNYEGTGRRFYRKREELAMANGDITAEAVFEKTVDALTVIQSSVAMLYKEVRRREDARANLQKENEDLRARIVELEKAK